MQSTYESRPLPSAPQRPPLRMLAASRVFYLPTMFESMSDKVFEKLDAKDKAFVNELGGGNKTVVSAQLVSALSGNGNAAIYLSQLLWWGQRKANDDGWFFRTRDQMQERCGLGKQAQRTAEKILVDLDLIETDRRGMPAKKHYRIDYSKLISLFNGAAPVPGGTCHNKSQGVGGGTSSGGYPPEQDTGGTYQDSIESNTKNNTETPKRARAPDDGDSLGMQLVKIWRSVDGAPPLTEGIEKTLFRWARNDVVTSAEKFREVLRNAVDSTAGRETGIDLSILRQTYEEQVADQRSKYYPDHVDIG